MMGKDTPMIFSAVLMICCGFLLLVDSAVPIPDSEAGQDALYSLSVECHEDGRGGKYHRLHYTLALHISICSQFATAMAE